MRKNSLCPRSRIVTCADQARTTIESNANEMRKCFIKYRSSIHFRFLVDERRASASNEFFFAPIVKVQSWRNRDARKRRQTNGSLNLLLFHIRARGLERSADKLNGKAGSKVLAFSWDFFAAAKRQRSRRTSARNWKSSKRVA